MGTPGSSLRRNLIGGGGKRGLVCCKSNKSRFKTNKSRLRSWLTSRRVLQAVSCLGNPSKSRSKSSNRRRRSNRGSLKTSQSSSNSSQRPLELKWKMKFEVLVDLWSVVELAYFE